MYKAVACATLSVLLVAGFVILKYECMSAKNNTFASSYCLEDNEMRSVISAIFTLILFVMGVALPDAISSYKSYKIKNGINEGVFISLASDIMYRLYAIRTKWAFIIIIIMFVQYIPGSIQWLSNYAIHTNTVYVATRDTASTFGYTNNFYRSTILSGQISPARNAIVVTSLMQRYATGVSSTFTNGKIKTAVIRNDYIGPSNLTGNIGTRGFKRTEVIGTIDTICTNKTKINIKDITNTPNAAYFNITGNQQFATVIYDVTYTAYDNAITFNTSYMYSGCTNCNNYLPSGNITKCVSRFELNKNTILYTVRTQEINIIDVVTSNVPINMTLVGSLVTQLSRSPEVASYYNADIASGVNDFYASIGPGPFNKKGGNLLHAKLCSSLSESMKLIWYGINDNAVTSATLYDAKLQAYLSDAWVWSFAGFFVIIALMLCATSIICSLFSPTDIQYSNEFEFLDNLDNDMIVVRRNIITNSHKQKYKQQAFNNTLCCKTVNIYNQHGQFLRTKTSIGYM